MRTADPELRWFFERVEADGPHLVLWTFTAQEIRTTAQRDEPAPGPVEFAPCASSPPTAVALSERAVEIAEASSAFALEALRASPTDELRTISHLTDISERVPAEERSQFLFQCWLSWSADLSPEQRIELVDHGQRSAEELLRSSPVITAARPDYLRALDAPTDGEVPRNYLLFDHAGRMLRRLGSDAATSALAALVLRTGYRTCLQPVPAPHSSGHRPSEELVLGEPRG